MAIDPATVMDTTFGLRYDGGPDGVPDDTRLRIKPAGNLDGWIPSWPPIVRAFARQEDSWVLAGFD